MDARLLAAAEELKAALESDERTLAYRKAEAAFLSDGEAQALKGEFARLLALLDRGSKDGALPRKIQEAKAKLTSLAVSKAYEEALKAYREALGRIDRALFAPNDLPSFFFERRKEEDD